MMTSTRTPTDGPKSFVLSPDLASYLASRGAPEDAVLRELVRETREVTGRNAFMQVAPEQGALLTLLCRLMGARQAIEVGTFTGYSSICIARGLSSDGRLITCDTSEEFTNVARRHFRAAGVDGRIELRLGDAGDVLRALPPDPTFDFAFLDADKPNYSAHYEALLGRLRPGGVLVIDNVLWGGKVIDSTANDAWTMAIRGFNDKIAADTRVFRVMLPVGDGMTIVRKEPMP